MTPLLLNIETATDICSVCISEGETIRAVKDSDQPFSHTREITLLIQACAQTAGIALADLDAIALSRGPGSYTALRVGTSVAKGLCYALEKPLIVVDTLQSLALACKKLVETDNVLYCPMIDNRRMEVLTAVYDQNMQRQTAIESKVITADSFAAYFEKGQQLVFAGNGAQKCREVLTSPLAIFTEVTCAAPHLVPLAVRAFAHKDFADLAYFEPLYVKPPNITTPKKRL